MTDHDKTGVVQSLKDEAFKHPRVPLAVPAQRHFHRFPNGLSVCFTQDVFPMGKFWHLSIARVGGVLTEGEANVWRQAFFDEEPDFEHEAELHGPAGRHFYWKRHGS